MPGGDPMDRPAHASPRPPGNKKGPGGMGPGLWMCATEGIPEAHHVKKNHGEVFPYVR